MAPQTAPSQRHRYLVLAGPHAQDARLLEALRELAAVRVVKTPDEALEALRTQSCDLVVSPATQIVPLARAAGHLRTENFLEEIGQGACVVNRDGEMIWANAKLKSYLPTIVEALRKACVELLGEFAAEPATSDPVRVRRRTLEVEQEHYFDLTASARVGADGQVEQLVALAWDLTETKRLQKKIDAIDAAGRELVSLDVEALTQMDVGDRLQALEDGIVACCRDLLHFDNFAIRILDKRTNRLDTVLATGLSEEAKARSVYALPEDNGITGYVAATGRSYICLDTTKDPHYLPGLQNAHSSLSVPLKLHDEVIGVFNIESDQMAAFSEVDRQFAEILGRHVAVALHTLELLAVERHATTGQLAADVDAELATPLNNIVSDVTKLMEEHAGDEQLRHRLKGIIDDVDTIKQAIHAVTEPAAVTGLVREVEVRDELLDGKRILIADDEDIIRETIADVLTKAGALGVMARDGNEAIAMIRAQHFDLVLSDIKMPNRNGYEVFAAAREVDDRCPVILITGFGYDPNHAIVRASKEGLAGVLFKPFKVEQLLDEVRHALLEVQG
jgi:CheY-like chemotaxis protein/PAS domain-containing protein